MIVASPSRRKAAAWTLCVDWELRRRSVAVSRVRTFFELTTGDFAVIGTDVTDQLESKLPSDAARAGYERIVVVTRETLLAAKRDIPEV